MTLALLLLGCAGDEKGDADFPTGGGRGPDVNTPGGAAGGGGGGTGDLPPEQEVELPFEAPQAGRSVVYVPNPGTHRVAVVDANTFSIETLATGLAPTYAATVAGQDLAIVLNVGSGDAAILRTRRGKTSVLRLPVGHDQNAIAVSPDGAHAVLYFDARESPASAGAAQSFQDVSVLRLIEGEEGARAVSVGFRPRGVQFSRDAARAFVVTEDGVSVVDLAATDRAPRIAELVSVGDKVGQPVSLDVQIVADGRFAIARRDGDAAARLVDLESGAIETLNLAALQPPDPGVGLDGGLDDGGMDAAAPGDAGTGYPLPGGRLELTDLDVAPAPIATGRLPPPRLYAVQPRISVARRHGDAGAPFSVGIGANMLFRDDLGYRRLGAERSQVELDLFASYDVLQASRKLVIAAGLDYRFGQIGSEGELLVTSHAVSAELTARYRAASWLAPHLRLGAGVLTSRVRLDDESADVHLHDRENSALGTLGAGLTLRTPARLFETYAGRLSSLSFGILLEGGYVLAKAASFRPRPLDEGEVPQRGLALGRLAQAGGFLRVLGVVRF